MGSEGPKKIKLPAERTLGSSQFPKGAENDARRVQARGGKREPQPRVRTRPPEGGAGPSPPTRPERAGQALHHPTPVPGQPASLHPHSEGKTFSQHWKGLPSQESNN